MHIEFKEIRRRDQRKKWDIQNEHNLIREIRNQMMLRLRDKIYVLKAKEKERKLEQKNTTIEKERKTVEG